MRPPAHPLFTVHRLNAQGLDLAEELAERFSHLAVFIEQNVFAGRERSLALVHLQEASMHAKRGIAEVKANQEG